MPTFFSARLRKAGLPAPEYKTEGFFTTILYKETKTTKKTTKKTGKKTGKKTQERILEIIRRDPQVTVAEIAGQCGVTYNGIYYHLEKMRAQGILGREGGDKGGVWVIF